MSVGLRVLRIGYDRESNFCTLKHSYNKRFVSFVSSGIKPTSYRKYNADAKCWSVHTSRLPLVVSFGKKYFDHVDYSALPEHIQIQIVKILEGAKNFGEIRGMEPPTETSPYSTLFVLESAPWEVITAAYKALAMKYHPDKGGSPEAFHKLQDAYDAVKSKRKP